MWYFITGGVVFGAVMLFRKDFRKTFQKYSGATKFSVAAMGILAWWLTLIYALKKKPSEGK
jgi:hypothetical protein